MHRYRRFVHTFLPFPIDRISHRIPSFLSPLSLSLRNGGDGNKRRAQVPIPKETTGSKDQSSCCFNPNPAQAAQAQTRARARPHSPTTYPHRWWPSRAVVRLSWWRFDEDHPTYHGGTYARPCGDVARSHGVQFHHTVSWWVRDGQATLQGQNRDHTHTTHCQ